MPSENTLGSSFHGGVPLFHRVMPWPRSRMALHERPIVLTGLLTRNATHEDPIALSQSVYRASLIFFVRESSTGSNERHGHTTDPSNRNTSE